MLSCILYIAQNQIKKMNRFESGTDVYFNVPAASPSLTLYQYCQIKKGVACWDKRKTTHSGADSQANIKDPQIQTASACQQALIHIQTRWLATYPELEGVTEDSSL